MQTERASEPVFAIKTTSRRTLGGNPRTNSISPHLGGSLLTHMCSVHRKSKSTESKGEQTPCLTQQPHHPLSAGQGTQGLTLTPPRLLSISFEECTGFIKPTQTGAPPPPPPNTHTLQQHNKHPETKSSWRKAPWTQLSAGRRAQRASVMAGARWGQRQRLQCFWEEIQGQPGPHSFIQSPTAGGDSTALGSPVESTTQAEMGIVLVRARGSSSWIIPSHPNTTARIWHPGNLLRMGSAHEQSSWRPCSQH